MKKLFTLFCLVLCCMVISQNIEAQDITICFWEDVDGDGADNDAGAVIAGPDIDLIAQNGNPDVVAVSAGGGCFDFTGLVDGEEYCFDIDPTDYGMDAFTIPGDSHPDLDQGTNADNLCLTWNSPNMDVINVGAFQFVEICGNVFQDCTNGTGVDGGTNYSDVEVEVLDDSGSPASDIDGNGFSPESVSGSEFCFDMLTPGVEYLFQFTSNDPNFVPSMQMNDNDMDQGTEQTTVTAMGTSGQMVPGAVDAGYVELISICGVVWEDCNGDFQNNDGQAYDDVDIEISGPGGAPITMPDGSGYPGSTTTNPSGGDYCFDGLPPGDYVVNMMSTNSDYSTTAMDMAGEMVDSDIDQTTGETATITIEN